MPDELQPPEDSEEKGKLLSLLLKKETQDLKLKEKELEIRREEARYASEYAKESLDKNAEYLNNELEYRHKSSKLVVGLIITLLLIFAGFVLTLVYFDKDELVMEIIKALMYIASGGVGGYTLRIIREKKSQDDQES